MSATTTRIKKLEWKQLERKNWSVIRINKAIEKHKETIRRTTSVLSQQGGRADRRRKASADKDAAEYNLTLLQNYKINLQHNERQNRNSNSTRTGIQINHGGVVNNRVDNNPIEDAIFSAAERMFTDPFEFKYSSNPEGPEFAGFGFPIDTFFPLVVTRQQQQQQSTVNKICCAIYTNFFVYCRR
jgi:hypothetical protein